MIKIALILIVVSLMVGATWVTSIKPTVCQAAKPQNKWKRVYSLFWISKRDIDANVVVTDLDMEPFPVNTITNKVLPEEPISAEEAVGRTANHRIVKGTLLANSDFNAK